jgi:hypothetical protein
MPRISQKRVTRQCGKSERVILTIERILAGTLLSVVFFGLLALLDRPHVIVLGKPFFLSITIAAIAAIALLATHKGALTAKDEETARDKG